MKIPNDLVQREIYGATMPFSKEVKDVYVRVVLGVAAADGDLSEAERTHFAAIAKANGEPDDEILRWCAFDPKKSDLAADVAELRKLLGTSAAYAFIYDAIRIARVDGFHAKEREAAVKLAARFDVPASVVAQTERLLELEDAVRAMRVQLFFPEGSNFHAK